jgi:hypothetical protein
MSGVIILVWLLGSVATPIVASKKHRAVSFWLASGLFCGIFALLVVLLLSSLPDAEAQMEQTIAHRTCPYCLSKVPFEATACRFCRRELPSFASLVSIDAVWRTQTDDNVQLDRHELYIPWSKLRHGNAFRPVHYRRNGFLPDNQWIYVLRVVEGVLAPYFASGWRLAGTWDTAIGREWMANRQDQYLSGVRVALQRPIGEAPETVFGSATGPSDLLRQTRFGFSVTPVPLPELVRTELTMLRQEKELEDLGVDWTPFSPSEETLQWMRDHPDWMDQSADEWGLS